MNNEIYNKKVIDYFGIAKNILEIQKYCIELQNSWIRTKGYNNIVDIPIGKRETMNKKWKEEQIEFIKQYESKRISIS